MYLNGERLALKKRARACVCAFQRLVLYANFSTRDCWVLEPSVYMHAVKPHRASSSSSSCTMWNIYFFHAGNIINFLLARIYSLGNGRAAAGSFFNLLCFDIFFKFCIYFYKMNRRLAAVFIKTISSLYVQQNPNRALYSVRVAWLVGKRKFNLDKKRCDAFKYV